MGLVRDGGVKPYAQSIEGAKYETQLCSRMTMLDLNDPLAADADTLGEGRLVELQLPAPVANNGAQIGGCANEHGDPKMSTFVDITICRRSLTMENVSDRRQCAMSAFVNNRKARDSPDANHACSRLTVSSVTWRRRPVRWLTQAGA